MKPSEAIWRENPRVSSEAKGHENPEIASEAMSEEKPKNVSVTMQILGWLTDMLLGEAPATQRDCEFKWGPLDGWKAPVELSELAAGHCWRLTLADRLVLYESWQSTEGRVVAAFRKYDLLEVLE